jgi:hypothetical protein
MTRGELREARLVVLHEHLEHPLDKEAPVGLQREHLLDVNRHPPEELVRRRRNRSLSKTLPRRGYHLSSRAETRAFLARVLATLTTGVGAVLVALLVIADAVLAVAALPVPAVVAAVPVPVVPTPAVAVLDVALVLLAGALLAAEALAALGTEKLELKEEKEEERKREKEEERKREKERRERRVIVVNSGSHPGSGNESPNRTLGVAD